MISKQSEVLIIGNPSSIFVESLANYFDRQGYLVSIVTYSYASSKLVSGIPVISSAQYETRLIRLTLRILRKICRQIDKIILFAFRNRVSRALEMYQNIDFQPLALVNVINGISMANYINRYTKPGFVFGQQVFSYGIATALTRNTRRILMPWGGDIFNYSETTPIASSIVSWSLNHVDLVCPTSKYAARYMVQRFGVRPEKIQTHSWGIDLKLFKPISEQFRHALCVKYSIPINAKVIMNVRRLHHAWGADVALDAFLELSKTDKEYHFIFLGGSDKEYFDEVMNRVSGEALEHRFTVMSGEVPLWQCAELMKVSHIFTSLMEKIDMRSASILQSAACGAVPVLTDQPEYREMEHEGFQAAFVKNRDYLAVVDVITTYLEANTLLEETRKKNFEFVRDHENSEVNLGRLLKAIEIL